MLYRIYAILVFICIALDAASHSSVAEGLTRTSSFCRLQLGGQGANRLDLFLKSYLLMSAFIGRQAYRAHKLGDFTKTC